VKRIFLAFVLSIIASLALAMFAFTQFQTYLSQPGEKSTTTELSFERGSSAASILKKLEDEGVITQGRLVYLYLRYFQRGPHFKAGDYLFEAHLSPNEVLEKLQTGFVREFPILVREGATLRDIGQSIVQSGLANADEVEIALGDKALIKEFGVPERCQQDCKGSVSGGMEGYLFPDTYHFRRGTPVSDILRKMRSRLDEVLDGATRARMAELGWSLHKTLTLASIVEKETASAEERPLIAGLFLNRLKIGMKLQTDPTVIYSASDFNGNIGKRDLQKVHPYNTYVIQGLPPGPIAAAGIASIRAALWPKESRNLYFVSRNDRTHEFCETYACHQKAVKRWQIDYFRN